MIGAISLISVTKTTGSQQNINSLMTQKSIYEI